MSFGEHDDSREGATSAFDPGGQLIKFARILIDMQVASGSDLVTYMAAHQNFLRAVAVILDIAENEVYDALNHYENTRVPAEERQKRRPKHVTMPLRNATGFVRMASTRGRKTLSLYRRLYAPVGKRKTKTSSGARRRTFNPAA
jgi:hypothetical protein